MEKKKITDRDYLFISSVLKAKEKNMLRREQLERMVSSGSFAEMTEILTEIGWDDMAGMDAAAVCASLAERQKKIYEEIDRYAPEIAPFSAYDEIAEAILKHIIESGKGIELNTSSFRYNMLDTTPSEDLLKLYHSLNGEIITVGSDAHYPDHVAFNFAYAYDYLRSIGFKYVCTFEKKKPIFHKLGY